MRPVPSWTNLPRRNRALALATLLLGPILYVASGAVASQARQHLVLAYDQQRYGCLPWGLYAGFYDVGTVERGDMVAFKARATPPIVEGGVVVKIAAGKPGDLVEIANGVLSINGRVMGDLRYGAQRLNKPITAWDTRYTIGPNEYFMLGSEQRSFDSRYWGVVTGEQIIAKMHVVL